MVDRRYNRRPRDNRHPPAPVGWGGVRVSGGRVVGVESNPELRDELWASVALEMMRTDDTIQAGVEAVLGTLLSARWTVSPGDIDSPFSRALADDLDAMMGLSTPGATGVMRRSFESIVESLGSAELIGVSLGEPRWGYHPGFGVVLEDVEDRAQSSIRRWVLDRGSLVAVEQAPPMEDNVGSWGSCVTIPSDHLVIVSRGRIANNWWGRGLLRGCFALWRLKRHLLDMSAIAAERQAVGVPLLTHDFAAAQAAGGVKDTFEADLETARDALDSLVAQERHWIEAGPGISIDMLGSNFDPGKSFVPMLDYCDRGCLKALLLGFLAMGMSDSSSGNRSLGETVESFFRRSAAQGLDRIASAFNGPAREGAPNGIIGRWVQYNHGPVDPRLLPRLGHAGVGTVHPLLDLAQSAGLDLATWLPSTTARRAILARELQLPTEEA